MRKRSDCKLSLTSLSPRDFPRRVVFSPQSGATPHLDNPLFEAEHFLRPDNQRKCRVFLKRVALLVAKGVNSHGGPEGDRGSRLRPPICRERVTHWTQSICADLLRVFLADDALAVEAPNCGEDLLVRGADTVNRGTINAVAGCRPS